MLVLDQQGHFQIIEIVGELAVARITLAALLAVIESTLDEQGGAVGELCAGGNAYIQAAFHAAAVEQGALAADV